MTVKGLTLSTEQHAFARERLSKFGNQTNIALEDYRHQNSKFDNIVSIEMFEAVGEKYWPTYFEKVSSSLKKGGKAVIQTITIDEARFDRYRKAGLKTTDEFHFGHDYARTLQEWLDTFDAKRADVKALGFDDGFIRLWRFYLAACIAGFSTNRTSVMQVELQHI